MTAAVLDPSQCILGEGPIWHAERKCCFWVDIDGGKLYEYNWVNKITRYWTFPYKVSMVIQGINNQLILALNTGIARFNLESETLDWLIDIEPQLTQNRCNDGACDSYGRLWLGTMDNNFKEGAGALYCIDEKLRIHKKLDKVTISNGIAWALDNKRLYYIDSPTQAVKSYIFSGKTGKMRFEKKVIQIPVEMGTPDGMTIDEEGMLWIAHWGGFGIYRWNPHDGRLIEKMEIPVPNVTSCTFAGENLGHLVITTAKADLNGEQLKKYPDSGNTFWAKADVRGVPSNICML